MQGQSPHAGLRAKVFGTAVFWQALQAARRTGPAAMAWHMALCRMRLLCFQGVLPARPCRRMQAGPPGGLPRQGQTFRQIFLVKICRVFRIMCKRPTLLCSVSDKTTNFEKFEKSRRKGPVLCYNKYDTTKRAANAAAEEASGISEHYVRSVIFIEIGRAHV